MHEVYIALDPGKTGALAIREVKFGCWQPIEVVNLARYKGDLLLLAPLYMRLRKRYGQGYDMHVAIENVHAAPRDTPKTAFNFGMNYGIHRTMIQLYTYVDTPFMVAPRTWQLHHGVGAKYATSALRKKAHLAKAKALHPDLKGLTLKTADAVLILDWLKDKIKGTKNADNAKPAKPTRRRNTRKVASDCGVNSNENVYRVGTRKRKR